MMSSRYTTVLLFFFFNDPATTEIYTLSLHDALPISQRLPFPRLDRREMFGDKQNLPDVMSVMRDLPVDRALRSSRSEEHTSELQSPCNLVCRLLLEKKKPQQHATRQDAGTRAPDSTQ